MAEQETTQIQITKELALELVRLKIDTSDTYESIIRRLIKAASQRRIAKDGAIKG